MCCNELLEKLNKDSTTVALKKESRRQAIRMGISSYGHQKRRKSGKLQKSLSIIPESESSNKLVTSIPYYLSPSCPVCLKPPHFVSENDIKKSI